jgi:glutamate--cysteine ligase
MITSPILLAEQLNKQRASIEEWFAMQWEVIQPPLYASVDLRHSGFKLAPVDVNLYPAGFNNLAPEDQAYASTQARSLLHQMHSDCKHILIITENHTRNLYYLENLASLKNILDKAGFTVKLSMLTPTQQTITTGSGQVFSLEIVKKTDDYLHIGDFIPDCIILNNDLSDGFPSLLSSIRQPILPSSELGWYQRTKSQYFQNYNATCQSFSATLGCDEWLINPLFAHCDHVNFSDPLAQTELIEKAQSLLNKIAEKYRFYHLSQEPYLIIKANSGSYGMGVLVIKNANDIATLSRKQRQHMTKTKGNRPIQSVILQEGVPTITHWNQRVAEPVMYLFGSVVVGGFYRTHTKRNAQENLNTPGMQLTPLTIHDPLNENPNPLHYAYQVIARLAVLAAAFETQALKAYG